MDDLKSKQVMALVQEIYGDTSVTREETRDKLRDIVTEIEDLLSTLR